MSTHQRIDRKGRTIRDLAEKTGYSRSTIALATSMPRAEWLKQMAKDRETIRRFHDEEGHSWTETAAHFKLSVDTVKQRSYKARKERAAEAAAEAAKEREKIEPPLIPLEAVRSA